MKRLLGGLVALVAVACPQPALAAEKTFDVSNCGPACPQAWVVPPHVTSATFDLYGGQGAGSIYWPDTHGGFGGRTTATLDVVPGQEYLIYVGTRGSLTDPLDFTTEGGRGSVVQLGDARPIGAGGGGGGSAVDGGAGGLETTTAGEGSEGGGTGSLDGPGAGGTSWGPPGTTFEPGVRQGDGLVTVRWDPFPQETIIESGPRRVTNDNTPTFSFTSDESGVSFQCFDEFTFGTCSGPGDRHTTEPLPDGRHTVAATATDAEGFTDPTPATRSFRVDTRPPVVRVTDRPQKKITSGGRRAKVKVAFQSPEKGTAFRCRLDDSRFQPCDSPWRFRARAGRPGIKHRAVIRGTDRAGNATKSAIRLRAVRGR